MWTHFKNKNQEKNSQKQDHYLKIIKCYCVHTIPHTWFFLGTKIYYIMIIFCNAKTVIKAATILLEGSNKKISESNKLFHSKNIACKSEELKMINSIRRFIFEKDDGKMSKMLLEHY